MSCESRNTQADVYICAALPPHLPPARPDYHVPQPWTFAPLLKHVTRDYYRRPAIGNNDAYAMQNLAERLGQVFARRRHAVRQPIIRVFVPESRGFPWLSTITGRGGSTPHAARLFLMRSVMFCRFATIMGGVNAVRVRQMRMVSRLLVLPGVMMLGRFRVMLGGLGMVFRSIFMVLSAFMHDLYSLIGYFDGKAYWA